MEQRPSIEDISPKHFFFDARLPELNMNSVHLETNDGFIIHVYELVQTPL